MNHTLDCISAQAKHETEVLAFMAKYPDYCKSCGGWEESTFYDPDAGLISDPCPECAENGRCGLCGQYVDMEAEEEGDRNRLCGHDDPSIGLFNDNECLCYMAPEIV